MMDLAVDGRGNLMNRDKCQMTPHFFSCFCLCTLEGACQWGNFLHVCMRKSPQYSPLMFCAQLLCTWRHQRFQFPKRFSDSSSCGSIARKTSYTWQTMKRLLLFATTCFKSGFPPKKMTYRSNLSSYRPVALTSQLKMWLVLVHLCHLVGPFLQSWPFFPFHPLHCRPHQSLIREFFPVCIQGIDIGLVTSYRYLGVYLNKKQLRSFSVQEEPLRTIYDYIIISNMWWSVADKRGFDKRIKKVSSILGCLLYAVHVVRERRMMAKLSSVLVKESHPPAGHADYIGLLL